MRIPQADACASLGLLHGSGRERSARPSALEEYVATLFAQFRNPLFRYLLSLGLTTRVDFQLSAQATVLGEVRATVNVDPLISPTRTSVSTTISDTALRRLPSLNRNFTDFVALTPRHVQQTLGQLFLAGPITVLIAGIVVGQDRQDFDLYIGLAVAISAFAAGVLAAGAASATPA